MGSLPYFKQHSCGVDKEVHEMLQLNYLPCAHIQGQMVHIIFVILYINIQVKSFLFSHRSELLISVFCVVNNIELWIEYRDIRGHMQNKSMELRH